MHMAFYMSSISWSSENYRRPLEHVLSDLRYLHAHTAHDVLYLFHYMLFWALLYAVGNTDCGASRFLNAHTTQAPQWGAADAEIKVPSGENTELKMFSL